MIWIKAGGDIKKVAEHRVQQYGILEDESDDNGERNESGTIKSDGSMSRNTDKPKNDETDPKES